MRKYRQNILLELIFEILKIFFVFFLLRWIISTFLHHQNYQKALEGKNIQANKFLLFKRRGGGMPLISSCVPKIDGKGRKVVLMLIEVNFNFMEYFWTGKFIKLMSGRWCDVLVDIEGNFNGQKQFFTKKMMLSCKNTQKEMGNNEEGWWMIIEGMNWMELTSINIIQHIGK